MTLFQLSAELMFLEEVLLDTAGEFTDDEPGKALEAYFDSITEEVDQKIESYCHLIQRLKYRAEAGRAEIKRIGELATADENAMERLKERLKKFVELHGKIRTPTVSLWVQNNGGLEPLIVPTEWRENPIDAPKKFHKVIIELDIAKIRESVVSGEAAKHFVGVGFGSRGTHLRIK